MAYFGQERFDVRCEWGIAGIEKLAPADVVIVVDVLSFSTSVDVALGRGAFILPYRWKDDTAIAYARGQNAEIASPRDHLSRGYSLSPSSLLSISRGTRLVLPSPNGSTLAFAATATGASVVAGCLRNALAVAIWANRAYQRIAVVPAGERWEDGSIRFAVEDLIGAGAILKHLLGRRSPEALAAIAAFEGVADNLAEAIRSCSSGRELSERGFQDDVELAAQINVSSIVQLLQNDAFVPADIAK